MAHITKVDVSNESWNETNAGLIAVGVFQDKSFTTMASNINDSNDGVLSKAIEMGDVKGKNGESNLFYIDGQRIQLLGLGKKEELNPDTMRLAAGRASRLAIDKKIDHIAIECPSNENEICQALAEGLVLGSYQFLDYKTKEKNVFELKSATVLGSDKNEISKGAMIGNAVCFARDLGNHPGNVTTPSKLASSAKDIADEGGMDLTVFERKEFT